jgi:hypothetical protein
MCNITEVSTLGWKVLTTKGALEGGDGGGNRCLSVKEYRGGCVF